MLTIGVLLGAFGIFFTSLCSDTFCGFDYALAARSFELLIFVGQLCDIVLPVAAAQLARDLLMGAEAVMGLEHGSLDLFLRVKGALHRPNPPCAAPCSTHQRVIKKARGDYSSSESQISYTGWQKLPTSHARRILIPSHASKRAARLAE